MTEFWETNFSEKQEMWGFDPAVSAVLTKDFFVEKSIRKILMPGIGYGRNAKIFQESGISVTGIEISETAIELAKKHVGPEMTIYHGSVTDMPFDDIRYDGVFCYGLIHLLSRSERKKLIHDCYRQLAEGGYMVFTAITKDASTYGQGTEISQDTFEMFGGVRIFFYDRVSITQEFAGLGMVEIKEVQENFPFYIITCKNM